MFRLITKYFSLALYLALLFLIGGCEKTCPIRVETVHLIQNLTARQLNLVACDHGYGTSNISVEATDAINEIGFGVRVEETMGLSDCTNSTAKIQKRPFGDMSLSSQSVDSVKLCFDESINTYFIIETNQTCAIGQIERSAVTECKYPLWETQTP